MSVESAPKKQAREYGRAIRGMGTPNHHYAMPSMAEFVTIAPPTVPPVSEYDEWLAAYEASHTGRKTKAIDGRKLRRIVMMVANGCPKNEIGISLGMAKRTIFHWLALLPVRLGGTA